jgi:hypothetical protein
LNCAKICSNVVLAASLNRWHQPTPRAPVPKTLNSFEKRERKKEKKRKKERKREKERSP